MSTIGRYTILGDLSAGGMSRVQPARLPDGGLDVLKQQHQIEEDEHLVDEARVGFTAQTSPRPSRSGDLPPDDPAVDGFLHLLDQLEHSVHGVLALERGAHLAHRFLAHRTRRVLELVVERPGAV